MAIKTLGNGNETFYVVAENINMGTNLIDIKITNNEGWAKTQKILMKIKANSEKEAKGYFRVRDLT